MFVPSFTYDAYCAWKSDDLRNAAEFATFESAGTKPAPIAVDSWFAGLFANEMNFHAAALSGHAFEITNDSPLSVVAIPGAWPFSVGMGAMPTTFAAWGQGA